MLAPLAMLIPIGSWAAVSMFLPRDTRVELRLKQTLSSAESRANDRVEFEVSEDVKVGDYVAIPAGSLAWGVVVEAVPRSRLMKSGKLAIDIRGVCLTTGERAALRGSPTSRENLSARESDEGPSTNVLALPALPVLLFVYGKDVTIPEGRATSAYVSQAVELHPVGTASSLPNTTCDRDPVAPAPAAADTLSTLLIRSTPTDAELTIDGRYLGNAPSTVRLPAGDHIISASSPGRKTWERTVHLTAGGEINITAILEERAPLGNGPAQPKPPQP
jgi:hypothetical protein